MSGQPKKFSTHEHLLCSLSSNDYPYPNNGRHPHLSQGNKGLSFIPKAWIHPLPAIHCRSSKA